MRSHTKSKINRAIASIEPLEVRRVLANVDAFRDTLMDNDGVPDLLITGNVGGENSNNIDIYIDFQHRKTIVHDDRDNIGVVNPNELYIYPTLFETIDVVAKADNDVVRVYLVSDFGCIDQTYAIGAAYSPFAGTPYDEAAMSIYADLGTGNDTFLLSTKTSGQAPNGAANLTPRSTTPQVNGPIGPGDPSNNLFFDTDGADMCCADMVVEVDGGDGNDNIKFDLERISVKGSLLTLNADGQGNDDTISLITPSFDPHNDGSFADAEAGIVGDICDDEFLPNLITTTELIPVAELVPTELDANFATGGGTNTVNITTKTDIRNGSVVDIDVEGGSGNDTVNPLVNVGVYTDFVPPFGPSIPSQFLINAHLHGGNDKLQAKYNLTGDGIVTESGSLIHIGATGGDGNDLLEVQNTSTGGSTSSAQAGTFDFKFKGGNGDDKVQVHLDSPVPNPDNVQDWTGTGLFKVYLNGDGGKDYVELDANFMSNPRIDAAIMGGSGDDKLVLNLNDIDPASGFRYRAPRNKVLIDGGTGIDQWDQDGLGVLFTTRGVDGRENDLLHANEV